MGSPNTAIEDIPVLGTELRDLAVESLAGAMAELAELASVTPAVTTRAALIVDAVLDRAGRAFVVLVADSLIDARTLASAAIRVSPKPRPVTDADVAQAAAAIAAIVAAGS